jgi:MFS family permease
MITAAAGDRLRQVRDTAGFLLLFASFSPLLLDAWTARGSPWTSTWCSPMWHRRTRTNRGLQGRQPWQINPHRTRGCSRLDTLDGRKRLFMAGLGVYGVGALLSAAAPGLGVLMVGNSLLEGVGTALLIPPV